MIIKKKEFAYSRKTREQWPFTVPEVAVIAVKISDKPVQFAFALVHNWVTWALSGILEDQHGLAKLKDSGIWADHPSLRNLDKDAKPVKKSLTPFFQYLDKRIKGVK